MYTNEKLKLTIHSLKGILFEGEAVGLNVKTTSGEITVLDNHETYIGKLTVGVMKVVDSARQEHFFEITSGFVEVRQGNEVRCLVE